MKVGGMPEYKHTYKLLYTQKCRQSRDFPLFYMEEKEKSEEKFCRSRNEKISFREVQTKGSRMPHDAVLTKAPPSKGSPCTAQTKKAPQQREEIAKLSPTKAPLVQRGVGFAQQNSEGLFAHTADLKELQNESKDNPSVTALP